jgi:hypothetical protein
MNLSAVAQAPRRRVPAASGRWVKRDRETGKFLDQKADPRPFKGVRRER